MHDSRIESLFTFNPDNCDNDMPCNVDNLYQQVFNRDCTYHEDLDHYLYHHHRGSGYEHRPSINNQDCGKLFTLRRGSKIYSLMIQVITTTTCPVTLTTYTSKSSTVTVPVTKTLTTSYTTTTVVPVTVPLSTTKTIVSHPLVNRRCRCSCSSGNYNDDVPCNPNDVYEQVFDDNSACDTDFDYQLYTHDGGSSNRPTLDYQDCGKSSFLEPQIQTLMFCR